MSTLAATKADGFYYPPDWTPEGGSASLSARLGKKAKAGSLGKRASKLGEGTLTVRFEMPFDVRCLGCDGTIARGVRFNARKKAVGKYHSTTIWSFSMRTACCSGHLEIRTDPKHAEFVIFEGAERRRGGAGSATRYGSEPALDLEGTVEVELQSREEREAMMADGMARLERQGRLAAACRTQRRDPARRTLPRRCDASRDSARIDGRTITRPTASFGARCARTVKPSPRDDWRARRWVYPSTFTFSTIRPPTPTPREPRFGIR